jgi:hypothetical protein
MATAKAETITMQGTTHGARATGSEPWFVTWALNPGTSDLAELSQSWGLCTFDLVMATAWLCR